MSSEIEQKIASALNGADLTSTDIGELITEVEAAAAAAGEEAINVREGALDPTAIVDTAEVGGRIVAAELTRDRLQGAVPKLRQRWHEVALAESLAAWRVDFEAVGGEVDEVAAEWNERYPQLVDELVGLMKRAAEVDRKVSYVNVNRPPGAQGHLETVEVTVRGRLAQPDVWTETRFAYRTSRVMAVRFTLGLRRRRTWRWRWRACRSRDILGPIGTRRSMSATVSAVRRVSASQRITKHESERPRSAVRPKSARPARRIGGSTDGSSQIRS